MCFSTHVFIAHASCHPFCVINFIVIYTIAVTMIIAAVVIDSAAVVVGIIINDVYFVVPFYGHFRRRNTEGRSSI